MTRRILPASFVLIAIVTAVAVAEPPAQPQTKPLGRRPSQGPITEPRTKPLGRRPSQGPITEPSRILDKPRKDEETRLDPVAQLEIAVQRLDNENKALKAQIDKMKANADALRKDLDVITDAVHRFNQGPSGDPSLMYATRKDIINGRVPDDAKFRVWFRKGTGFEKADQPIIPEIKIP